MRARFALRRLGAPFAFVLMAFAALTTEAAAKGDVAVRLAGQRLVIRGDAGPTSVEITATGGTVVVTPFDGTTINGSADPAVFDAPRSIAARSVDMSLSLTGLILERGIAARLDGEALLQVTGCTVGRNLRVRGRDDTFLSVSNGTLDGSLRFRSSGEESSVLVSTNPVERDVKCAARDGDHRLTVLDSMIGRSVSQRQRDRTSEAPAALFTLDGVGVGRDVGFRVRDSASAVTASLRMVGVGRRARFAMRDALAGVSLEASDVARDLAVSMRRNETESVGGLLTIGALSVGRTMRFRSGDGPHALSASGPLSVGGRTLVALGSRRDEASGNLNVASGHALSGGVRIRGTGGLDQVTLGLGQVEQLRLDLRDGDNIALVASAIRGSARVRAGDGDDVVEFAAATVGGTFSAKLGGGNNLLTVPGD